MLTGGFHEYIFIECRCAKMVHDRNLAHIELFTLQSSIEKPDAGVQTVIQYIPVNFLSCVKNGHSRRRRGEILHEEEEYNSESDVS
eukprot:SAG22_NODE_5339_length_1033_cov_1.578158_3_plen_86_part_00